MTIQLEDTATGVCDALALVAHRPATELRLDADLANDLSLDSLAMIELSVALEERFGITMPAGASPEDLRIRTVADVVRFVEQRRAEVRR